MSTSHTIWDVIEEGKVLKPYSGDGHHIKQAILFEMSDDNEDGTYPRVSDYVRLANRLDNDGTYAWVNRLTRKRNKTKIEFFGATITRSNDWSTEAVIEFKDPIEVVFGYVGEDPIIQKVKKIEGEFTHDWFWMKNGRQSNIANGFEIWFNIKKFLE